MASYSVALKNLLVDSNIERNNAISLKEFTCWQAMKSCGFDESTLDYIFKELYLVEIWRLVRGDEVNNQNLAEQLFITEVSGGVAQVILAIQEMFALPCSGKVDSQVLELINRDWSNEYCDEVADAISLQSYEQSSLVWEDACVATTDFYRQRCPLLSHRLH